jgi:SPP1 family predicted phage head-tail adaptor
MNWRDVVYLIPATKVKNSFGEEVDGDGTPREVMANQKSVMQKEFYSAYAVGLSPTIIFEIKKAGYNNEKKVLYEGTTYHVIRHYSKNGENIELTCSVQPMEGLGNG